ncbi:MAG: HNH endonuclease [Actinobacteria bacterium]|nr:HNH endonuclease [Actinomycetota bacterium]
MKAVRRAGVLGAIAIATVTAVGHAWSAESFTSALKSMWATIDSTTAPAAPLDPSETGNVIAGLLDQAHVVNSLPKVPGYERGCKREQACSFGPAWNDPQDHSGCDTRSRILKAQLTDVVVKPNTHNCKVLSGTLHDPYTGSTIAYDAARDPSAVQLDHVFALARAFDAGAAQWNEAKRVALANDPVNLFAVSGPVNRDKSDSGLEWLPPNRDFQCTYIARYLAVAVTYDLSITTEDRDVAVRQCPAITGGAV